MNRFDILISGPIYTDLIFAEVPRLPEPGEEVLCGAFELTCGGSAFITSVALARLGAKVSVLSPIGNDLLSDMIVGALRKEGVETDGMHKMDRSYRNVSAAVNWSGDRAFLTYEDQLDMSAYCGHLLQAVEQTESRFVLLQPRPAYLPVIERARSAGKRIVFDLGWDEAWLRDPRLKDILRLGHVYTPNLREALAITGAESAEAALRELSGLIDTVIVKLGASGALVAENGQARLVPGFPARVVDATGAGDNFLAGFLAASMRGWPLERAVRLGHFCGASSVQGLGGTAASTTWERVIEEPEFQ